MVSRWHLVLLKYFWPIRLAKLLTVQGDSLFASSRPMLPWLVAMLALTWAGSVGTLPVRGGLTGLVAGPGDAGYWQLAPTVADGLNGGNGGAGGVGAAGVLDSGELLAVVLLDAVAVLLLCSLLVMTTVTTTAATTRHRRDDATDDDQDPARSGLLGAAFQLPLEFALGCRTSLFVGRHGRYASMVR